MNFSHLLWNILRHVIKKKRLEVNHFLLVRLYHINDVFVYEQHQNPIDSVELKVFLFLLSIHTKQVTYGLGRLALYDDLRK